MRQFFSPYRFTYKYLHIELLNVNCHFDILIKEEVIQQVQRAFDELPESLKAVRQLKEYTDLNYKEIGAILGITEGNVKIRVFRARKKLLKILGENNVYLP